MRSDAVDGPPLDPARSAGTASAVGPAARFDEVVLPHLDDAYDFARWLTRNPQDAEEVVQEAVLRALRFFNAATSTNPRAWLLTIVRNTFYTWLKAKRTRDAQEMSPGPAGAEDPDAELELWDPDQGTPETALVRKTEDEAIRSFVEALPAPFRETLILREMEGFSYQEIAEMREVPIGTVMSRLSRARGQLQTAWRDYQGKERVG